MKQILILLVIALMFSCGNSEKKETSKQNQDALIIKDSPLPEIIIDKKIKDKIDQFRIPVRDVAYYFLTHPNNIKIDEFYFKCDRYHFWVANGSSHFRLERPVEINLERIEKDYFWNLYIKHRDHDRLFYYEEKYNIKTQS